MFPNLLGRARSKAFSISNIQAGFRATGIWPYNPSIVLQNLSLPEPEISLPEATAPLPPQLHTAHDLLTYQPTTPVTPRSIHNLYVEGLSTITSNSPCAIKQRAILTKMKMGAERAAAQVAMHQAGENHLREEIKQIIGKGKIDNRRLNSEAACILEKGTTLAELKRARDEAENMRPKGRKKRKPLANPPPVAKDNVDTPTA